MLDAVDATRRTRRSNAGQKILELAAVCPRACCSPIDGLGETSGGKTPAPRLPPTPAL